MSKYITPGDMDAASAFTARHRDTLIRVGARQVTAITITHPQPDGTVVLGEKMICVEMDAEDNPFELFPGYPWRRLANLARIGEPDRFSVLDLKPSDFERPGA